MTGTTVLHVFLGLTLTGPKKASKRTFLHNRLNKEKTLVDVANLLLAAMMIMMYYWRFWEPWAMLVSNPVAKTLVWIENHDRHNCFCMPSWGSLTLTGPKKASKRTVLHNRSNKEKLLVDVANLATCCHDEYDVLLEVLGTLGKCYVSNPVAKTLVWIENHDWHNCFCMSSWAHPYWTQKSFKTNSFT